MLYCAKQHLHPPLPKTRLSMIPITIRSATKLIPDTPVRPEEPEPYTTAPKSESGTSRRRSPSQIKSQQIIFYSFLNSFSVHRIPSRPATARPYRRTSGTARPSTRTRPSRCACCRHSLSTSALRSPASFRQAPARQCQS